MKSSSLTANSVRMVNGYFLLEQAAHVICLVRMVSHLLVATFFCTLLIARRIIGARLRQRWIIGELLGERGSLRDRCHPCLAAVCTATCWQLIVTECISYPVMPHLLRVVPSVVVVGETRVVAPWRFASGGNGGILLGRAPSWHAES
jgi:hypothetical protein